MVKPLKPGPECLEVLLVLGAIKHCVEQALERLLYDVPAESTCQQCGVAHKTPEPTPIGEAVLDLQFALEWVTQLRNELGGAR